jgi:hypothetical protein
MGEVYVAGFMAGGPTDYGPYILPANGRAYLFVAKLNTAGTWLWARQTATGGSPGLSGMALDAQNNIYLAGTFQAGTVTFGTSTLTTRTPRTATTYPSSAGSDLFVAKLTDAGSWLWAIQGDPNGENMVDPPVLAFDGTGHLYVGGAYGWLSARIGGIILPNLSTVNTAPQAPIGQVSYWEDAYVARLNTISGTWEWAIRAGGTQEDGVGAIAADGQGRVYVAGASGYYTSASNGFANPLAGGGRVNLGQLNGSTGAWQWTLLQPNAFVQQVALDGAGRVCTGGSFTGATASFGSIALVQQGGPSGTTGYIARMGAGPLATHVASAAQAAFVVWPNPAGRGAVWVQGPAPGQDVQVLDALGRVVGVGHMPLIGPLNLALPATISAGLYVVRSGGQSRQLVVE